MDEVEVVKELKQKNSILEQAVSENQITQKYQVYEECLQSVNNKNSFLANELAIIIITKFYNYFPHLQNQALDCLIDLCEAPESQTRICAIKNLPKVCRYKIEELKNIAFLLSQMLLLGQPDYNVVCDNLGHVFTLDPFNAIDGIFENIDEIGEGPQRDKILDYTYSKLSKISLEEDKNQQKVNEILLSKARNRIKDCSTEEFLTLMKYMVNTSWAKSQGRQELFQIIEEKIEIDKSFHLTDIDRLDICVELIMPLFDHKGDSSRFVTFYCQKVLPKLQEMSELENGDQYQIELLKQLTLMSRHCKEISPEALDSLLDCLKEFVPVPPEDTGEARTECPSLDLCHIECLLCTFHNLCKISPEFLQNDLEKFNDLKTTLQYLTSVISEWDPKMKKNPNLRQNLSREDKIRLDMSVKIFKNLLEMSEDFFQQPPVYKAKIQLSFSVIKTQIEIQPTKTPVAPAPPKRISPITFDLPSDLPETTSIKPPEVAEKPNLPPTFDGRGSSLQQRGGLNQAGRGYQNWFRGARGRGRNLGYSRGRGRFAPQLRNKSFYY